MDKKYNKNYFKDLIKSEKERVDNVLLPSKKDLEPFIKNTLSKLEERIKKAPYSNKAYIIRFTPKDTCALMDFSSIIPDQLVSYQTIFLDKDVHPTTLYKCLNRICCIFKEDYDIIVTISDEDLWIPLSQFEED